MHRTELIFSDRQSLTKACCCFVRLSLLVVVNTDQEVGIARFQTVFVEELFNYLDVTDISTLALLFHVHGIVEGAHQSVRLQDPAQVFVLEHILVIFFGSC